MSSSKQFRTPQGRLQAIIDSDLTFQEIEDRRRLQNSSPTKTGNLDVRTPQQKNRLKNWAYEYKAAGYRTTKEILNDIQSEEAIEAIGDENPPTKQPITPSSSKRIDVNINHNYNVVFTPNLKAQFTLEQQIEKASKIALNRGTRMFQEVDDSENDGYSSPSKKAKTKPTGRRAVSRRDPFDSSYRNYISALDLRFAIDEIPILPPHWTLKEDPKKFVQFWETNIIGLQINGIGVPMEFWRDVYAYNLPSSWTKIKEQWSRVRLCYYAWKLECNSDWQVFTTKFGHEGDKGNCKELSSWTKIWKGVQDFKIACDKEDATKAKEMPPEDFEAMFSTGKGKKKRVFKSEEKIAQVWRISRSGNQKRFWDEFLETELS